MRIVLILLSVIAVAMACVASEICPNCRGDGIDGDGAVQQPCMLCEGTGQVPSKEPEKEVQPEPPAKAEVRGNPRAALVRIVSNGKTIRKFSGVMIDPKTVLTAWHCIADQPTAVQVHCQNGKVIAGRVVSSSEPWDVAVIEVPENDAAVAPLASAGPAIGEELEFIGYGPGLRRGIFRAVKGRVTSHAFPMNGLPEDLFEMTGSAREGDSGGPIFNKAGEVVGVISGTDRGVTIGANAVAIRGVLEMPRATAAKNCPDGKCQKR